MMQRLYQNRRWIASVFLVLIVSNLAQIPAAYALTSGPSQPEMQAFQPAGTTDMVDLFSGDFSYNIPLFELPGPNGGYPFNLSYQSGITMDQEASWVGLGFSLNPGAINRQMRGLPDEFNGDPIYTKTSVDPSVTVGLGVGVGVEIFGSDNVSLGVGLSVSHNSYKGLGYSIDGSIGFQQAASSGATSGIGLNISLSNKEGVGLNPSLSLAGKMDIGAAYNSKEGLSSVSLSYNLKNKNIAVKGVKVGLSGTLSTTLSLASPGYTPQVSMPMRNINLSAKFKAGGSWWGIFGSPYVTGFYNEQWLKDNKKRIQSKAFGYLNYQHATDANDVLDFNREKDGMVTKESPNLGIPSLTYDIYSVTGQGIGAMYRPMRNDYGIVRDPEVSSVSVGGSVGVDVGPAASHIGVSLSVSHSKSTSGAWNEYNNMASQAKFQGKNLNDLYEPWYFKAHGEPSSETTSFINGVGGSQAVRVKLTGSNLTPTASSSLERNGWNQQIPNPAVANRERKSRSQVIQPITNEQLMAGSQALVSYFNVTYINKAGMSQTFTRNGLPGHHVAGFTALTPAGLRYNYGIPAYNLYQEDVTFSAQKQAGQTSKVNVGNGGNGDPAYSHANTEKFLKKVEMPPYAHSYLLTSIIGPDYVDVTNNGITEDDLGYWVKFTYTKTTDHTDQYKWREPFSKAHYLKGWETDPRDDKGSFSYGEKELWYLTQAETKSHITTFTLQEREDGRGVATKLQDSDGRGKSVYALKEIKLFTRSAGSSNPIKVVKFEYDYSLCKGVFNSNTTGGKLTLKKVWFEYGNSQRGKLNPYVFIYHTKNPNYDQHAYDRWGNYKPYPAGDYAYNQDFPYVGQDPLKKAETDENAAAWSLKELLLPSGGKIIVDYESDDYGYVQHLPAMQMTEVANPYVAPAQAASSPVFSLNDANYKIRFKLERAVTSTLSADQQRNEVLKYLDQKRKQIYFKLKINLRSPGENFHEYISGYADIDFAKPMGLEKDASGTYTYGFFSVVGEDSHHPFSMRAWQHLRVNQPELANSGRRLKQTDNTAERVSQIKSLGSVWTQVRQMFQGFYNYCNNKNWGKEIIANKSWIRLNSPDKTKNGGGLRVRQITMKDNWTHDEEGIYGQVYEYTMEENNQVISSGVAAYEPLVGGDENPLRYAKKYVQTVPLRSDNNLFFEYPINESYFPGPQVGYRKVTVTSLPAASLAGKEVKNIVLAGGKKLFPQGANKSFGTTGMTVHEFYTAKDFPVITDETEKDNKPFRLNVPIPFLGNISISKLSASQGYSILTNDMHGKQKQVSNYRQDKSGKIEPEPISWVKYNYLTEPRSYQQENVHAVAGVFKDNGDGTLSVASATETANPAIRKFTMGQENEFMMDMRQYEDNTWGGGANINVDIVYIPIIFAIIPIPIPSVWPNISKNQNQLRTAVTNKVIFKSGILESMEAYDGGSVVKTKNLKWDKHTGAMVLSAVNNTYDAPVYNYTVLAHTQYQGMGAAYQNIGLTFVVTSVQKTLYKDNLYRFTPGIPIQSLYPGDEILLYTSGGKIAAPLAKVVFVGQEDAEPIFYSESPLYQTEYQGMIIRSGYRNQLEVPTETISALADPSKTGTPRTHTKKITIPNIN